MTRFILWLLGKLEQHDAEMEKEEQERLNAIWNSAQRAEEYEARARVERQRRKREASRGKRLDALTARYMEAVLPVVLMEEMQFSTLGDGSGRRYPAQKTAEQAYEIARTAAEQVERLMSENRT